jgi:phospholipase D1/2
MTSATTPRTTPDDAPLLRPGATCWRIARADRLAVIVDAADYFATVREAAQQATHSLLMIGWDFDTRIMLDRPERGSKVPNRLGRFLAWVVRNRPHLQIRILRWDLGVLKDLGRGSTPLAVLDLMSHERIHFKLDSAHPAGAAHHQKIIVIDDALAFCGGIDMTADRWDTREHRDDEPWRRRPTTRRRYTPWHDVSTAVDREAARALGALARERWQRATGETLEPPPATPSAWPDRLRPLLRDVDVAIARTLPDSDDEKGVHEIEALYLAAIRGARHAIYIESQYFASRRIAEAMAERLWEADGPEIVVVNPESADGWLEEEVMGSSRARILRLIAEGDRHGRFRIYTPVTAGRQPIYVHAKVMVVDDRLLKVGSSNLNNRSLGFDTECDLAVEAPPAGRGGAALRAAIVGLRNDLIAEHLGVDQAVLERAIESEQGSLVRAIDSLRSDGRSLVPFEPPALNEAEEQVLAESALLDPERPSSRWHALRRHLPGPLSGTRRRLQPKA